MSNVVIKVENLGKQYRLGEVGTGSLKDDMKRWRYRMMKREDPFLKIGDENDRTIKTESQYVWALKDINFEVKKGEVLGIVGKNGAGKSTLLKILSRTTGPTIGSVRMKGRIASLLEVGTGFHGELSGRDNIYLNGSIMGMHKSEIKRRFDEIVEFAGVEKYIDTPVKRYSSGMYVRLAFGVAAHLEPDIMIVDEVLAVGDAEFQKKALGKMKEVSTQEGRTVLFVSHNLQSVRQLCSKGILLRNGQVSYAGSTINTVSEYLKYNIKTGLGNRFENFNSEGKDFQLIEAIFYNELGENNNVFGINDEIDIQLTIRCTKKVPHVYGYMVVKNRQEEIFIESDTFDFLPNILDSIPVGDTSYLVKINKNILPAGEYVIYINFSSTFAHKFNVDSPGNILGFKITDQDTRRGEYRKAFTSQLIKWEINNVKR